MQDEAFTHIWVSRRPRISTIQAVLPINYNSVKKNEARARDILKTELTTPENTITYHNALCLSPQNFA